MNLKKLAKKAAKALPSPVVNASPVGLLYAGGGAINKLTGGKTTTYSLDAALSGKAKAPKYSKATQALSGYQGATPNGGDWRLPVANRSTTTGVGQLAATIVKDVAAPVVQQASKSIFGVELSTLAWIAAGSAVGLGGVYVATR